MTPTEQLLRDALEHIKGAALDIGVSRNAIAAAAESALTAATQQAEANAEPVRIKLDNGSEVAGHRLERNGLVGWSWKSDKQADENATATHWKPIASPAPQDQPAPAVSESEITDHVIEKIWTGLRRYHGGEPCKMAHVEFARELIALARTAPVVPEDCVIVPKKPTEQQWGGLARDIVMAWDMNAKTPRKMFEHLNNLGRDIPEWLRNESEMKNLDHVPSKGTRAVIVYRAMIEDAAPSAVQEKP